MTDDPLVMPQDEFELVKSLREKIEAALDASIDRCARCKVCDAQINAVMTVVAPAVEHAADAAAGSHEGIRLWMLDCSELVAKHRERAERAEATLDALYGYATTYRGDPGMTLACEDILGIIGREEEAGHGH